MGILPSSEKLRSSEPKPPGEKNGKKSLSEEEKLTIGKKKSGYKLHTV